MPVVASNAIALPFQLANLTFRPRAVGTAENAPLLTIPAHHSLAFCVYRVDTPAIASSTIRLAVVSAAGLVTGATGLQCSADLFKPGQMFATALQQTGGLHTDSDDPLVIQYTPGSGGVGPGTVVPVITFAIAYFRLFL